MTTPITTTTELEALPVGSVMRGKGGALIERGTTPVASDACAWLDGSWFFLEETIDLYAPLTILHVPGQAPECDHAALVRHLAQSTALSLASAEAVVHAATTWTTPAPAMKPDREDMVKALYAGRRSKWSTMPEDLKERWRKHADLILDELPGKTEAQVRAEALRDAQQVIAGEDSIDWARTASGTTVRLSYAMGLLDDLIADEEAGK